MKKLLMPVMALLLIIQSGYLLAAADDYFKQAMQAARTDQWKSVYKLIDDGTIDVNEHSRRGVAFLDVPLINKAISSLTRPEAVQELLKRRAELDIQVEQLPLMTASPHIS